MIIAITNAIEQRNRVSFKYKVEIYVLGINIVGALAIRAYDLNEKKFKLFFVDLIDNLRIIMWSKFYINRPNYNPYSDSYFMGVICKI